MNKIGHEPGIRYNHVSSTQEIFDKLRQCPKGTVMAKLFPFSFADGCIFRIYSPDKTQSFDMRVTGSYRNMVDPHKYSIELEKL